MSGLSTQRLFRQGRESCCVLLQDVSSALNLHTRKILDQEDPGPSRGAFMLAANIEVEKKAEIAGKEEKEKRKDKPSRPPYL